MSSWWIVPFNIIYGPSLCLVTCFWLAVYFVWYEYDCAHCLWLPLAWSIFFHPFSFSLCFPLELRWMSWRQHLGVSFLSTGGFNPFIIRMIISRRKWQGIDVQKGKNLQPRRLYPARSSFRIEGERKNFSNKWKLNHTAILSLSLKKYWKFSSE